MLRLPSGIKDTRGKNAFDKALGGGFPVGDSTLVVGKPGTCKTTFCAQMANENAKLGKKCVYVSLEQADMPQKMASYGIKFNKTPSLSFLYIDLYKDYAQRRKQMGRLEETMKELLAVETPSSKIMAKKVQIQREINRIKGKSAPISEQLFETIEQYPCDVLVIDSLDALATEILNHEVNPAQFSMVETAEEVSPVPKSEERLTRREIRRILSALKGRNITSFLISEQPEDSEALSRDGVSDFMTDNIIILYYVGAGVRDLRSIKIRKLRGSAHEKGYILFDIGKNGIKLVPEPPSK